MAVGFFFLVGPTRIRNKVHCNGDQLNWQIGSGKGPSKIAIAAPKRMVEETGAKVDVWVLEAVRRHRYHHVGRAGAFLLTTLVRNVQLCMSCLDREGER